MRLTLASFLLAIYLLIAFPSAGVAEPLPRDLAQPHLAYTASLVTDPIVSEPSRPTPAAEDGRLAVAWNEESIADG